MFFSLIELLGNIFFQFFSVLIRAIHYKWLIYSLLGDKFITIILTSKVLLVMIYSLSLLIDSVRANNHGRRLL